jgi:ferritin-like metal-binding protein YciE
LNSSPLIVLQIGELSADVCIRAVGSFTFTVRKIVRASLRELCPTQGITALAQPEVPMAKKSKSKQEEKQLDELFVETLKDIYYAEKKILTALPKMAKAAQSEELAAAFERHADETDTQVDRLEQVFLMVDETPKGKTCEAINGLIDEAKEIMSEFKNSPAHDAGLLASAQAVEHYEISRYGTLRAWAEKLGMRDAVKLLDATLAEEKRTDEALTQLAATIVNDMAEAEAS